MADERPERVYLTGDREGPYLLREERADGSLVLTPDRADRGRSLTGSADQLGPLAQFLSRQVEPVRTTHEALEAWGADLAKDEFVVDFVMADVDDQHGFVALTSRRFIFLVRGRTTLELRDEYPREQIVSVERMRRGRKSKLVIRWQDAPPIVVDSPDRAELERLRTSLLAAAP